MLRCRVEARAIDTRKACLQLLQGLYRLEKVMSLDKSAFGCWSTAANKQLTNCFVCKHVYMLS
jgi:hypothetical protein